MGSKPLLAGHEDLLRELTTARGHITLAEIQATLAERGIEAGCLTETAALPRTWKLRSYWSQRSCMPLPLSYCYAGWHVDKLI